MQNWDLKRSDEYPKKVILVRDLLHKYGKWLILYDVNRANRKVCRLSDAEFDAADNNNDDDYDDDVGLELFPFSLTKLKLFFLIIVAILMKMTMLAVTVRMKI